ncbi:hypothetical protein Dsin_018381 [Dipteronia sinensis]|uniref:Uncharacterized protein n=1 Tax=Dipteronia sinensis TaxID=43782 RepID=A0AAE0A5G2_9ROSI|nr:hypothetical protein Dsin_018381 [Dipteronia sinensis]
MSFPDLSHAWDKSGRGYGVGQLFMVFVPPCPVLSQANGAPNVGQQKVVPSCPVPSRVPNAPLSDDVCTNDAPTYSSSGNLLDRRFVIGVLKFCSNERCLELGRRYHALIIKSEVSVNQFVGTSLVGMFAKCGDMSLLVARLTPDFVNLTSVY